MEVGNNIKVKTGATQWMKDHNFWIGDLPETIDGLEGVVIADYTYLNGDDKHYGIEFKGVEYMIGIHPKWLE